MRNTIPVITIDGPAASGKGSIAQKVAAALSFHYLDSGKIYRALAVAANKRQISAPDTAKLIALTQALATDPQQLHLLQRDPTIVSPPVGQQASQIAKNPALRQLLIPLQRGLRQMPGLVADGRDMGSVIFPDATVKVFLTADLAIRAERRLEQLQNNGIYAKITDVCEDLAQRDQTDRERAVSPLTPPAGALHIDSTQQSITDIVKNVIRAYHNAVFIPPSAN